MHKRCLLLPVIKLFNSTQKQLSLISGVVKSVSNTRRQKLFELQICRKTCGYGVETDMRSHSTCTNKCMRMY